MTSDIGLRFAGLKGVNKQDQRKPFCCFSTTMDLLSYYLYSKNGVSNSLWFTNENLNYFLKEIIDFSLSPINLAWKCVLFRFHVVGKTSNLIF